MMDPVSIDFDIDTYLAKGGKILDLQMPAERADFALVEREIGAMLAMMSDKERGRIRRRLVRISKFYARLGRLGAPHHIVTITEERARAIWRETEERPC
jgi:hypothetical protein